MLAGRGHRTGSHRTVQMTRENKQAPQAKEHRTHAGRLVHVNPGTVDVKPGFRVEEDLEFVVPVPVSRRA